MSPSADLLPGHPVAYLLLVLLVVVDSLFTLRAELAVGAAILFVGNTIITFIWCYRTNKPFSTQLLISTALRGTAYVSTGVMIVVLSNMTRALGEHFRSLFFQGIGAVELLYSLHLVAAMFERFRPIYVGILTTVDSALPWFDLEIEDIQQALNGKSGDS